MAAVSQVSTAVHNPGPSNRSLRRENDDLHIFRITSIDSTDTFTPFPLTGGYRPLIYDWALRPYDSADSATATPTGSVSLEMTAVYTAATSSAAAFWTFVCTPGSGTAYLYVWAK